MRKQKIPAWLTCVIAVSLLVPVISGGLGADSAQARPAAKKPPQAKLSKDLLNRVRNAPG